MTATEQAYHRIMSSDIFRLNGEQIDLPAALIELCNAIKGSEETNWDLGDCLECSLSGLLIGAYWALTEWHGGQWSDEYAALCAIGGIYSPGMSSGPEPDSDEQSAYELICEHYNAKVTV